MATIYWLGTVDGDLTNSLNYDALAVPTTGDDCYIDPNQIGYTQAPSSGSLECDNIYISSGGVLNGVTLTASGVIEFTNSIIIGQNGGSNGITLNGSVNANGCIVTLSTGISWSGTVWSGSNSGSYVNAAAYLASWDFSAPMENHATAGMGAGIYGGSFSGAVDNYGDILGGSFSASVINESGARILGGTYTGSITFYGTCTLTDADVSGITLTAVGNITVTNSGCTYSGTTFVPPYSNRFANFGLPPAPPTPSSVFGITGITSGSQSGIA